MVNLMNDVNKLKNYIEYLRKEHNLSITLKVDENDMISKEQISELLAPLCDVLDFSYDKEDNNTSDIINEVKKYIQEHRSFNITSEDVCKALSCSRSHISHQFKSQTGMSIREYITVLRLNDAKHLLKYSDLSITEIAFTVGFGSSNYFTNVFKKDTGMSPGTYRKTAKDNK